MQPGIGELASGYGVSGVIAAVPELQPLAREGIWRVTLAGESFGRLVRRGARGCGRTWALLQMDDVTDEQFEAYEAAMRDAAPAAQAAPGP